MTICWPCDWFVNMRKRQRRAQGVCCETFPKKKQTSSIDGAAESGVVAISSSGRSGRRKGKLAMALTRMRDAYVLCMVNAASSGDCSALIYGNGYFGNDFQFGSTCFDAEEAAYTRKVLLRKGN